MKTRIDAGTDVAMIGAWDASRSSNVLSKKWGKEYDRILEEDAAHGHLFFINTGGDGGGPIDVYVDETVPESVQKELQQRGDCFLVFVPTGRLVVGGVEDYRSDKPQITGENSIVTLPAGAYLLHCYISKNQEQSGAPSSTELRQALGDKDYRYYRKKQKLGCSILVAFVLLFPVLIFPLGWKVALAITVIGVLGYPHLEGWILKRNSRYQRILKIVDDVWQQVKNTEQPVFAFQMQRVEQPTDLKGGFIDL